MAAKQQTTPEEFTIHSEPATPILIPDSQPIPVDTPDIAPTQEMEVETQGTKRSAESKAAWIRKAARGNEVISNFMDIVNDSHVTIPMIQQQFIMHGFKFDPNATKKELIMEIDKLGTKRWVDAVEDETIRKRLRNYEEENGNLPIVISGDTGASSSKDARKRASSPGAQAKAKAKTKSQASSSNDPQPKVDVISSSSSSSGGEEKSFDLKEQAPLTAPSRISLQEVRNFLAKAHNNKKITDTSDLATYLHNGNIDNYKGASAKDKKEILQVLSSLYKKYVYDPHAEEVRQKRKEEKQRQRKEKKEEAKQKKAKPATGSPKHVKKKLYLSKRYNARYRFNNAFCSCFYWIT
jgi:hypothetical protein